MRAALSGIYASRARQSSGSQALALQSHEVWLARFEADIFCQKFADSTPVDSLSVKHYCAPESKRRDFNPAFAATSVFLPEFAQDELGDTPNERADTFDGLCRQDPCGFEVVQEMTADNKSCDCLPRKQIGAIRSNLSGRNRSGDRNDIADKPVSPVNREQQVNQCLGGLRTNHANAFPERLRGHVISHRQILL
ncbi:hypothetical protein [Pannonibacter carbonis]|uniref:hypothetical protein n=1 Tax=Pannonibacter carbonis TaxID=2067569 RepID=UPI0013005380|nr:hypothetical protein [Pannonibacter carbonis]